MSITFRRRLTSFLDAMNAGHVAELTALDPLVTVRAPHEQVTRLPMRVAAPVPAAALRYDIGRHSLRPIL